MNYGNVNIVAGFIGLLLAACGGMALGITFDQFAVRDGNHVLSIVRFYLREGHSHGMPISFYNLFIGLLLDRVQLSNRLKKTCMILALIAFFLPIGLVAKGAAGAPIDFPPIGMIGVLGVLGSIILMLIGALRIPRT
jgi:hypothetical protein